MTIVQIETKEALENVCEIVCLRCVALIGLAQVDAIAKVPGVDVLFVGPFDLGNAIGYSIVDGVVHDELKKAIAKIQRAAKENEKSSGIYATSGDQARVYADQGFNMVSPWPPSLSVRASTLWMSSRCQRPANTNMGISCSGFRGDGYGRTTGVYDFCTDCCQRVLRPLSIEYGQGSSVRAGKDDRVR